jgi:hypothetical protein
MLMEKLFQSSEDPYFGEVERFVNSKELKTLALIGPPGAGKSGAAFSVALRHNAIVFQFESSGGESEGYGDWTDTNMVDLATAVVHLSSTPNREFNANRSVLLCQLAVYARCLFFDVAYEELMASCPADGIIFPAIRDIVARRDLLFVFDEVQRVPYGIDPGVLPRRSKLEDSQNFNVYMTLYALCPGWGSCREFRVILAGTALTSQHILLGCDEESSSSLATLRAATNITHRATEQVAWRFVTPADVKRVFEHFFALDDTQKFPKALLEECYSKLSGRLWICVGFLSQVMNAISKGPMIELDLRAHIDRVLYQVCEGMSTLWRKRKVDTDLAFQRLLRRLYIAAYPAPRSVTTASDVAINCIPSNFYSDVKEFHVSEWDCVSFDAAGKFHFSTQASNAGVETLALVEPILRLALGAVMCCHQSHPMFPPYLS